MAFTETGGPAGVDATLALADWRRTIAGLYAEVRARSAADPADALALWRSTRERLYREHVQSPVPAAARAAFRAHHFDRDPSLRFEVIVEALEAEAGQPERDEQGAGAFGGLGSIGLAGLSIDLPVSAGGAMAFQRFGAATIPFPDGPRYLLDAAKDADLGTGRASNSLVLDFNFAFQPSCAFDPKWACPLAPPSNRLDLEVRAGERLG